MEDRMAVLNGSNHKPNYVANFVSNDNPTVRSAGIIAIELVIHLI